MLKLLCSQIALNYETAFLVDRFLNNKKKKIYNKTFLNFIHFEIPTLAEADQNTNSILSVSSFLEIM